MIRLPEDQRLSGPPDEPAEVELTEDQLQEVSDECALAFFADDRRETVFELLRQAAFTLPELASVGVDAFEKRWRDVSNYTQMMQDMRALLRLCDEASRSFNRGCERKRQEILDDAEADRSARYD